MRLKDADALMEIICARLSIKGPEYLLPSERDVYKVIDEAPTIDAVTVVRCRDCKHYQFAPERAFGRPVKRCEVTGFEDVEDNDFCSRGARMDGK